jgi:hypothetical protein
MNNKFRNEILMEGYLYDLDLENKSFFIKCNDDIIEFKYNDNFNITLLEELKGNELIRIKGAFDKDDSGIYQLALGILVMPKFMEGDN